MARLESCLPGRLRERVSHPIFFWYANATLKMVWREPSMEKSSNKCFGNLVIVRRYCGASLPKFSCVVVGRLSKVMDKFVTFCFGWGGVWGHSGLFVKGEMKKLTSINDWS